MLALARVRSVVSEDDPFVGFGVNLPLFEEHPGADGEPVLRTAANKQLFNVLRNERRHLCLRKPLPGNQLSLDLFDVCGTACSARVR